MDRMRTTVGERYTFSVWGSPQSARLNPCRGEASKSVPAEMLSGLIGKRSNSSWSSESLASGATAGLNRRVPRSRSSGTTHRLAATFPGRERDVRDESASVCLGGAGRQCIEAVLPLATDEVRVDIRAPSRERRAPIRPTRQCRGKSLYKTQPACIQVRETV